MKTVLKFLGFAIAVIALLWLIDIFTGYVNRLLCKSSYDNPKFCYRISNISDLTMNVECNEGNLFIQHFTSSKEDAYVAAVKTSRKQKIEEKRLTYGYAALLDTMIFSNLNYYHLEKEKKPWYSYKIMRDYSYNDTIRANTVTIFARDYIYVFYQMYSISPDLEDRLADSFHSSRTFCINNIIAVWSDRYFSFLGSFLSVFVDTIAIWIWTFGCFLLCLWLMIHLPEPVISVEKSFSGFFDKVKESIPKVILWYVLFIAILLLFAYLALHDYFMDWIMSYGPFWMIPAGIFIILFGDGE